MDNRRLPLASWREAGRSILNHSGKLLFGLGMAATLSQPASGARKDAGEEDDKQSKREERREARAEDDGRDDRGEGGASAEKSEQSDDRSRDENQESEDRAEKRERREERSKDDEDSVEQQSESTERGSVARKQEADSGSDEDDGADGRGGRRSEDLAQESGRDDEPNVDETVDDVPVVPPVTTNPNVPVDTAPDLTDVDLFIEANPDVVASVSSSGGFAFARSGNIVAVSGPDGAQIVQTDDLEDEVVTPAPSTDEPTDGGGNNDIDFTS